MLSHFLIFLLESIPSVPWGPSQRPALTRPPPCWFPMLDHTLQAPWSRVSWQPSFLAWLLTFFELFKSQTSSPLSFLSMFQSFLSLEFITSARKPDSFLLFSSNVNFLCPSILSLAAFMGLRCSSTRQQSYTLQLSPFNSSHQHKHSAWHTRVLVEDHRMPRRSCANISRALGFPLPKCEWRCLSCVSSKSSEKVGKPQPFWAITMWWLAGRTTRTHAHAHT